MPDSQKPRYVITCNFKTIRIYDRDLDPMCRRPPKRELALADIPTNVSVLSFLRGTSGDTIESHAVNARAGELMGQLHDIAAQGFSDPDTPEAHHALSVLMTRLMFLLFCEDAGILADEQFTSYVSKYDADDLRGELKRLFSWLGTPDEDRDEYASKCLKAFPYIGGDLFGEDTDIPPLTDEFRDRLIAAGNELDWSGVSPTVFGSIFEGTLSHDHRREQGQHFTSPENIHKVIDPLFMDYLEGEFNKANSQPKRGNRHIDALTRFHRHLGEISILDPACGSGNFLTESYLSLRALEDRVIAAIHDATGHSGQASLDLWGGNADGTNDDSDVDDATSEVLVSLRNFHGIELEDFACCVARTALWIAEKQADARTAAIVQRSYDPLPLTNYHSIRHANALRTDWNDVVPASDVTYVIGNPPFLGVRMQSKEQKAELMDVFDHAKNSGNIDYVAGWYMKAAKYAEDNPVRCAFVSTNSICQGEQVANVWKPMSDLGFHIDFAYRSFKWKNEASDPAAVTVIIVGFSKQRHEQKVIWDEHGQRHEVGNINAYLVDGPNKFVWNRNMPLCNVPLIGIGNLYHYGILQSTFHNAWMRRVGGRLGTGYSYSGGVVYNNLDNLFPPNSQYHAP